ncbi:PAS domain-containing protein [Minwuia sp.]|uniref:PAS domain-containing protein n=1 Tax=Minwuia sp. TaxID=2493630 RepID=UPI003A95BAA4
MARARSDLTCIEHPELQKLADFWFSVRGDRLAPPVSEISPDRFQSLLPAIWMCDVVEDDPDGRFRYRLAGDHIRTAHGGGLKGRTLEQITDEAARERVVGYFAMAVDRPAIIHIVGQVFAESPNPAKGERLILPFFSETEDRVVRLLGATLHSWEYERERSTTAIPTRQVRTFLPLDGSEPWSEDWL